MAINIQLTIKVKSDFHIGAGAGRGRATDAVCLTDENGVPYIPGSTIKGLASCQAKRLIALYPESNRLGPEPNAKSFEYSPYYEIFGGGNDDLCAEDRVFFDDAHFSGGEFEGQTIRTGRNSCDRLTGRAKQDQLFFFEDAPAAIFETVLICDSDLSPAAFLLLVLSLRRIEALGGQRRRGKGLVECEVRIAGDSVEFLNTSGGQAIEEIVLPNVGTLSTSSQRSFETLAKAILQGERPDWQRVTKTRRSIATATDCGSCEPACWLVYGVAHSPLTLAHDRAVDNVVESMDHIPGPTMRGAVAGFWLRNGIDPTTDAVFQKAIVQESVRFGPLYPVNGNWTVSATMPMPLPASFFTCKRHPGPLNSKHIGPHGVTDRFHRIADDHCRSVNCTSALVACSGYLQLRGNEHAVELDLAAIQKQVIQRTAIDHVRQRGADGQLFGMEAIPKGTWFGGYVWGPEDLLHQLLSPWINESEEWAEVRIGKVRSRGHGRLKLRYVAAESTAHDHYPNLLSRNWSADVNEQLGEHFYFTLYSDLIALDRLMRPVTTLGATEIWRLAGGEGPAPFRVEAGYASTRRVGGYLGTVGLPRTSDLAIKAGSTWKLKWTSSERTPAWQTLNKAQNNGIGFRKAEGFGRIMLNCPLHLIEGDPDKKDLMSESRICLDVATARRPSAPELNVPALQRDNWMSQQFVQPNANSVQKTGKYRRLFHEIAQEDNPVEALINALQKGSGREGKRDSLRNYVQTSERKEKLFGDKRADLDQALIELKLLFEKKDKELDDISRLTRFQRSLRKLAEGLA